MYTARKIINANRKYELCGDSGDQPSKVQQSSSLHCRHTVCRPRPQPLCLTHRLSTVVTSASATRLSRQAGGIRRGGINLGPAPGQRQRRHQRTDLVLCVHGEGPRERERDSISKLVSLSLSLSLSLSSLSSLSLSSSLSLFSLTHTISFFCTPSRSRSESLSLPPLSLPSSHPFSGTRRTPVGAYLLCASRKVAQAPEPGRFRQGEIPSAWDGRGVPAKYM